MEDRAVPLLLETITTLRKLPPASTAKFQGREELIKRIHKKLKDLATKEHWHERNLVLFGYHGVGKTELIRKFIDLHEQEYPNVVWIHADTIASTTESFRDLANTLHVRWSPMEDLKVLVQRVYRHVCLHVPSSLFIFDNPDALLARDWIYNIFDYIPRWQHPNLPLCVFTIGSERWEISEIEALGVEQLTREESVQFLKANLRVSSKDLEKDSELDLLIRQLYECCGGYPFTLQLATAYLNNTLVDRSKCQLSNRLQTFVLQLVGTEESVTEEPTPTDALAYSSTLRKLWEIVMYRINSDESASAAKHLLKILTYTDPHGASCRELKEVYDATLQEQGKDPALIYSFDSAMHLLKKLNLVQTYQRSEVQVHTRMHGLVQKFASKDDSDGNGLLCILQRETSLHLAEYFFRSEAELEVPRSILNNDQATITWLTCTIPDFSMGSVQPCCQTLFDDTHEQQLRGRSSAVLDEILVTVELIRKVAAELWPEDRWTRIWELIDYTWHIKPDCLFSGTLFALVSELMFVMIEQGLTDGEALVLKGWLLCSNTAALLASCKEQTPLYQALTIQVLQGLTSEEDRIELGGFMDHLLGQKKAEDVENPMFLSSPRKCCFRDIFIESLVEIKLTMLRDEPVRLFSWLRNFLQHRPVSRYVVRSGLFLQLNSYLKYVLTKAVGDDSQTSMTEPGGSGHTRSPKKSLSTKSSGVIPKLTEEDPELHSRGCWAAIYTGYSLLYSLAMADYDENGGSFHEKLRKWLPPPKSQFDVPWPCENQFEVSSTIFVAACLEIAGWNFEDHGDIFWRVMDLTTKDATSGFLAAHHLIGSALYTFQNSMRAFKTAYPCLLTELSTSSHMTVLKMGVQACVDLMEEKDSREQGEVPKLAPQGSKTKAEPLESLEAATTTTTNHGNTEIHAGPSNALVPSIIGIVVGGDLRVDGDVTVNVSSMPPPVATFRMSMAPIKTFQGRDKQLKLIREKLRQGLKAGHWSDRTLALVGFGGMGKTELVRKFLELHEQEYPNVAWINAETEDSVMESFQNLAEDLRLPSNDKDGVKIASKVYSHVGRHVPSAVFVFDNAIRMHTEGDSFGIIKYLPKVKHTNQPLCLITSQTLDWKDQGIETLEVLELTQDESVQYLMTQFKLSKEDLKKDSELNTLIDEVYKCVDGYPLALQLAAANVRSVHKCNPPCVLRQKLENFVAKVKELDKKSILDKHVDVGHVDYDRTLGIIWEITKERIDSLERSSDLLHLLYIVAYTDPYGTLSENLKEAYKASLGGDESNGSITSFYEAQELLRELVLIQTYKDVKAQWKTRMHRMIQNLVRHDDSEGTGLEYILRGNKSDIARYFFSTQDRLSIPSSVLKSDHLTVAWLKCFMAFTRRMFVHQSHTRLIFDYTHEDQLRKRNCNVTEEIIATVQLSKQLQLAKWNMYADNSIGAIIDFTSHIKSGSPVTASLCALALDLIARMIFQGRREQKSSDQQAMVLRDWFLHPDILALFASCKDSTCPSLILTPILEPVTYSAAELAKLETLRTEDNDEHDSHFVALKYEWYKDNVRALPHCIETFFLALSIFKNHRHGTVQIMEMLEKPRIMSQLLTTPNGHIKLKEFVLGKQQIYAQSLTGNVSTNSGSSKRLSVNEAGFVSISAEIYNDVPVALYSAYVLSYYVALHDYDLGGKKFGEMLEKWLPSAQHLNRLSLGFKILRDASGGSLKPMLSSDVVVLRIKEDILILDRVLREMQGTTECTPDLLASHEAAIKALKLFHQ